jgi:DNA-binding NarL/FixJ family response regulator
MHRIRVLIAVDHAVLGSGLRLLLGEQPDLEVVAIAATVPEAIQQVAKADVALFDLAMPGGGIQGLSALIGVDGTRVITLAPFANRAYIEAALRLGAAGYLTQRAEPEELITAIRAVSAGGTYVERALAYRGPARSGPAPADRLQALSPRELQVLELIARGHTNREIGERLGVSVKTIEGYRARVIEKLGARTRAELVAYAIMAGLLPIALALTTEDE